MSVSKSNTMDKVIRNQEVKSTTNYKKFKIITGNRDVDTTHVRKLVRKMEKEGNRTDVFPIIVNEKDEVIDGQHRIAACQALGFPVYYQVIPNLTIEDVRIFNTGNKNWNWKDRAMSWAIRGNKNYKQFMQLSEEFNERFSVLYFYVSQGNRDKSSNVARQFAEGEFVMRDYDTAYKLLSQYRELAETAGLNTREFALAAYRFMRNPKYDHKAMLSKIAAYGDPLHNCRLTNDYLFTLEEIQHA